MNKILLFLVAILFAPVCCRPGSLVEDATPTPEIFIVRTQAIPGEPIVLAGVELGVTGVGLSQSFPAGCSGAAPLGTLISFVMLMLLAAVGVGVVAQTLVQLRLGISYNTGQLIGLIGSWFVLGLFAIGFSASMLRNLSK